MTAAIILVAIATILNGITLILNCKALVNISETFKHFRKHQIGFNRSTIQLFEEITSKKSKDAPSNKPPQPITANNTTAENS